MRRERAGVGVMLLVMLLGSSATRATAGDLPREIGGPLGQGLDRIKRVYGSMTVQGTITCEYPQDKKMCDQNFTYRAAGAKVRIDVKTTAKQGMGSRVGAVDMYMATPDGSLHSFEGPGSPSFDNADEESNKKARVRIDNMCLLTLPYSFDGRSTVFDTLRQSSCTILGVEKITSNGQSLVKINFQESTVKWEGHPTLRKSWLVVSPNEGWAVRDFSRTVSQHGHDVTLRATVAYSGMRDGVPLVSRIEYRQQEGPKHKTTMHQVVVISNFQLGAPDEYYFTAFAF